MIGYTRKVGLRKPGTWEWVVRNQVRPLRIKVQAGSLCAMAGLMDTIQAAKATVDALPADQRARLEGEFQRAEQEAAAIVRHGRTEHPCPDMSCPHCPCTYTAECCHCGDGQVHK